VISAVLLALLPALAAAQRADTAPGALPRPALEPTGEDRYEPVFEQLRRMAPRGDRVATVRNLTVRRDVVEFRLEDGRLYLLTPVAGRTVGAAFAGHGSVSVAPPLAIERAQLKRVLGDSVLDTRISAAVFVFADSTLPELERQLTFGTGDVSQAAWGPLSDALDRLLDRRARKVEAPTLMSALLNGDVNGFFYGHVKRERGEDLMLQVDPEQAEQVALLRNGRLSGQKVQIVCQFPRAEDLRDSVDIGVERPAPLKVEAYRIEATIGKGLAFSATATLRVTARREGLRWMPLELYDELEVDSVVDEAGKADSFFRAKRSTDLWVRLDPPLRTGETRSVRVA